MIYQLGPWQFNTEKSLLYCKKSEKELDPLEAKLLLYFINHAKTIISRQQLIDDVWQQSYVDNNAINRAMSALRKHLQHASLTEPLIKTHYRQGYSLVTDAQVVDINKTKSIIPSKRRAASKRRRVILCSSLVLLALTLSVYWYTQPQNTLSQTPDFKLGIIDNDDINSSEATPLFSDNKDYLASTRSYLKLDDRKIHVRRLADNKEIILTHPDFKKLVALSWQNQKNRLIVLAYDLSVKKCEYLLADISDFDAQPKYSIIKPCNIRTDRHAALDKAGRFFYYTSLDNKYSRNALIRFDLKTQKTNNLVPARPHTYGPQLPQLSPDEKKLAYLVWGDNFHVRVYLKDLATFETTLIYISESRNGYSYAMDWVNNDTLRYIDHDQMLTFDINNNQLIQSATLPRFVRPRYITHQSPTDIYFTTRNTFHYEIKKIDNFSDPNNAVTLFESKQNSNYVDYDNVTDNYYFISQRSGYSQIWVGNQRGTEQLTDFQNEQTRLRVPRVSPDGKYLLYMRGFENYEFININTREIGKVHGIDIEKTSTVRWGVDSHSLLYIDERESYQIKHYNITTQQHSVFATLNALSLFINNKGIPYALTEQGLIDLTTEKVYPLPENIKNPRLSSFYQIDDYFYATNKQNFIYRWQHNDKQADEAYFNTRILWMDVTDKHEFVIITRKLRNIKIERLWWSAP